MIARTRRSFLVDALGAAGVLSAAKHLRALPAPLEAQPSTAEIDTMRKEALAFMDSFGVPGMQVAVARQGHLVYEEAFGVADPETKERLSPSHLFRIASVTKPITSAAVFTLVERGRLSLKDPVFGPRGILGDEFPPPYPRFVQDVRLEHLLTHTAGGWQNDRRDPMFQNPSMGHHELIAWALKELPLEYAPGEHYAYSNFGYCLLGRIIEKATSKPYAQFVRDEVLARCGVTSMRVAGNTLDERLRDEVYYLGQREDPYQMNVRRMDSHGGWLATASALVRFATRVDGLSPERNILKPETIGTMTTASTANPGYAKGWSVNPSQNWWHTGSLPGTTTILVRTASGLCWAALTNTRREGMKEALDPLVWRMVRKVPEWHA